MGVYLLGYSRGFNHLLINEIVDLIIINQHDGIILRVGHIQVFKVPKLGFNKNNYNKLNK